MKNTLLLIAATFGLASTAYADGPSMPIIAEVPVVASPIDDWTGLYLGGQYSSASYNSVYTGGTEFDGGGSMYGLLAGYNYQTGNMVFGGEVSYLFGEPEFDGFSGFYFTNMLDVKARAGYAFGDILPYATVGWSMSEWTNSGLSGIDAAGIAYGAGVDYRVTDAIFVGVEYLVRDLVTDGSLGMPGVNLETSFSTISVRLGYSF